MITGPIFLVICDLSHLLDSLYQVPAISYSLFFVLALASEEGILGPCYNLAKEVNVDKILFFFFSETCETAKMETRIHRRVLPVLTEPPNLTNNV